MHCNHQGFHSISSTYDRGTKVLTYFRICDACDARLTEVTHLVYEPQFDPGGNEPYLSMVDAPLREVAQAER